MNTKKTPRARLLAISGAALALVVASGAAVSAHHGEGSDQRGFGRDRGGPQFQRGADRMGQGMLGLRGGLRGAFEEAAGSLVRRETIAQTEDGIVTKRLDNGIAASSTDATFEYTLATGETVEVNVDDETQVIAFTEQTIERGFRSRSRMMPTEITLAEIGTGSKIGVWADSQDDGSFLAQRIVVHPDHDEAAATDTDVDTGTAPSVDAASVPATDA